MTILYTSCTILEVTFLIKSIVYPQKNGCKMCKIFDCCFGSGKKNGHLTIERTLSHWDFTTNFNSIHGTSFRGGSQKLVSWPGSTLRSHVLKRKLKKDP